MTGAPIDDRGLLLGDGLFETILARDGALVMMEAHGLRMQAAAATLDLPFPSLDFLIDAALGALRQADLQSGRAAVRLTLTAGSGGRGLDRPLSPAPRLLASAAPAPRPSGPVSLVLTRVRRNESSPAARLKTLAYLDQVLARREAQAQGADEALMLNTRGSVACAAAANLFWIVDGRLCTPSLDCGVLDGIMRAQVLAAAAACGLDVGEVDQEPDVLDRAEAVFLTSSLIGVRAVERIGARRYAPSAQVADLAAAVASVS